ncbi:MAG: exosome complex protein Rrp42 [Nanoarchaeota archaeon]|nr:exosome complex protein Rrp42 [Nanoarchaeota archaeon]MBU0962391.1 exosome complex protein Rrp42 [Nanoarchaeota archaeon]
MKSHLKSLIEKDMREDSRKLDEHRKIKIEYGISTSAEGSARVTIGDTIVIAGVKMSLGTPFSDTPDEGVLIVNTELLPLSSPDFESGPPNIKSIELSRVVDRGIRESGAIDVKKLCIKKGEKVWLLNVDVYPLNDAGNLFDAASIAAIAALKDTKIPVVKDDKVEYKKRGTKSLPLDGYPVECTVYMIGDKLIVDPTTEEEELVEARLTVATYGNHLCAMQKGGVKGLTPEEVEKMVDLAVKKTDELRKLLK